MRVYEYICDRIEEEIYLTNQSLDRFHNAKEHLNKIKVLNSLKNKYYERSGQKVKAAIL